MKSRLLTLLAGFSLFVPVLFEHISRGNESLSYPVPALVLIPMFLGAAVVPKLGLVSTAAFAVPVVLFFLWNPGLFQGRAVVPKRSYVLLIVATLADAFWFIDGYRYGLRHQGTSYTQGVLALNIVWIAALWLTFVYCRKSQPRFGTNLLAHWMLFLWLAWYAFPLLGNLD
jgi:hypothetical protein